MAELDSVLKGLEDLEIDACESLLMELDTSWKPWPVDQASANRLVACGMAEYFGEQVLGSLTIAMTWSGLIRRKRTKVSFADEAHTLLLRMNALPDSWRDQLNETGIVAQVPVFMRLTSKGMRWKGYIPDDYSSFVIKLHHRDDLSITPMVTTVLEQLRASFGDDQAEPKNENQQSSAESQKSRRKRKKRGPKVKGDSADIAKIEAILDAGIIRGPGNIAREAGVFDGDDPDEAMVKKIQDARRQRKARNCDEG